MKKEITVNAKTIEEAVARAAEELGVAVDKIEYTVTTEPKKGFLGIGATFAEIVATTEQAPDNKATAFIKTVVEDMGIEAEVNTKYGDNGGVVIEITGDDAGVLIGHHGETLDALQYLAEYIKVALDIAGYREKREETLRGLARRQAERVLKYKRSVVLEPMNPYERRIIHSEIQGIEGVSTNSIGSENNRRVVIFLADKTADEKEDN